MPRKINILHIITHDTGRQLGCYGADVKTPAANRIAKEGIQFTNYFSTAPQCSPSRASMFSGLMPHNNGMIGLAHRGFSLNQNIRYLPKILSENGYATHLFGFQHECRHDDHLKIWDLLGYQEHTSPDNFHSDNVFPLLNKFLMSKPAQPFFISAGVSETHRPFPVVKNPEKDLKVPLFLPDALESRKDIAGLNILIERVDNYLEEILLTLDRTGLSKNTLVIFTTDHGIAFPGAKATLLDPGTEILLLMRGPGFRGGKKVGSLISNLDLTPTILEYLGIKVPEEMQGVSFLPVVRGKVKETRKEIYTEMTYHAAYDPMRSIRTGRYKYIRCFETRPFYFPPNVDAGFTKELASKSGYFERIRPFEFLFDLKSDPLERNNLINSPGHKKIAAVLKIKLAGWMKKTDDPLLKGPVPLPERAVVTPPWAYDAKHLWEEEKP